MNHFFDDITKITTCDLVMIHIEVVDRSINVKALFSL